MMKLKKESALVRAVLSDKTLMGGVDTELVTAVVERLFSDKPEIKASNIDEADALSKRVMEWLKQFPSKSIPKSLSGRELRIMEGMLIERIETMHLQMEQLLFDLGVIERGQTDT